MKILKSLLILPSLLLTCQSQVHSQLRESYNEQQNMRQGNATELQNVINIICKHGQFIAPAFGASRLRDVYLVDRSKNIFKYTDNTVSGGVMYDAGPFRTTHSVRLSCETTNILGAQLPVAFVGKLGRVTPCPGDKEYSCEYSIEKLGLYVYKKHRDKSSVSRIFLANHREQIDVNNSGTYRQCDGYNSSPDEIRACFGK